VDLIRSDDLDLVEAALQGINQQIIDKKSLVQVMKSFSKVKSKDAAKYPSHWTISNLPAAPRSTEIFRSNYEGQKIKRNLEEEDDGNNLTLIAGVLINKASQGKEAIFADYKLVFNKDTTELSFFDLPTNTLQYRSI
jgi:hypothetical protein